MRGKWLVVLILFMVSVAAVGAESLPEVSLVLNVGDSEILNVKGLNRVSTSNPQVVEVAVTGGQEVLINAKLPGTGVVHIWNSQRIDTYRITVHENYRPIEKELAGLIKQPKVAVIVNAKYVILNGEVETSLDAEEAVAYAKMYRDNVMNNLQVKRKYQILLSIQVTEISKENQNKYGFRWGSWVQTQDGVVFNEWKAAFVESASHTIAHYPDNWGIGNMLDVMQKNGDAKILAAPSILTLNEKEASFLAGGEIPVPVSDGDKVKVEWKEYGVKLKVKPSLRKDHTIRLTIAPEVSTLDWANSILLDGYKVPAMAVRKASTELEVKAGATIAIGGLLKREDSRTVYKLPFLGDLPIIGAIFRSHEFQTGDTELLFFVTPTLISDHQQPDPQAIINPADQGPYFQKAEPSQTEAPIEAKK